MDYNNHKNLSNFLKFFINRPNHLAKYLLDNDAMKKEFLNKLQKDTDYKNLEEKIKSVYFSDVEHMNSFFNKLINPNGSVEVSDSNLLKELEKELQISIVEERYEDAIRIRDYLKNISDKKKIN